MRLRFLILLMVIIWGGFALNEAKAQSDTADTMTSTLKTDSSETVKKEENVVLLLARPTDASPNSESRWMAALIEAYFEFKSAGFNQINIIPHDSIKAVFPEHSDFFKSPSEDNYFDIAKKFKAQHVGIQKFELQLRQKTMFYYLEIYSAKTRGIETTIERNFKLNSIGTELDEVFVSLLKEFNIQIPPVLSRFVKIPAISSDQKTLKMLGECIIRERFSSSVDSALVANEYVKVCEKDRNMLLAYYRAGSFLEVVGRHNDAAQAYNMLFMAIPEFYPVYLPLARNYRKSNMMEDALRITILGEQRGLRSAELISEKAYALEGLGRKKEAEKVYENILKNDPDDPFALLYFARINNDKGKAQEALEYGNRLIKLKKNQGKAYLEYGRSLMLLSKNEEALSAFNEASRYMPDDPQPDIYLGDLNFNLKRYSKASAHYLKVIDMDPDNVDAYLKAAKSTEMAGDSRNAYELLKKIAPKYTNHGVLQRELGVLGLINGDTAKAKIHLEASVRSGTADDRVLMGLGWVFIREKDYEKAFSHFTKVSNKKEYASQCNLGLSIVYIKRGQISSALECIKKVSPEDINTPGVSRMLADALLSKGDKENALKFYRKETAVTKDDTSLQSQIASLSYETEPASVSRSEYLKLVSMGAGGTEVTYRLAILSLKLKDNAAALKYFARAQEQGDADAQTWFELAQEFKIAGNLSQSLVAYEKCVLKQPSNEIALLALSEGYQKSGKDSAAARTHLKLFNLNHKKYEKNLVIAGELFEKMGNSVEAKNAYALLLQKQIKNPQVNLRLAHLEFKDKKYSEVIRLLQDVSPSLIEVKDAAILAESYINTDQVSKALPQLEYILKNNPRDLRAIELSAKMHEKNNNIAEATVMYKKYLAQAGKNAEYAFHLVELYEKLGKTTEAEAQLLSNVKIYPSDYRNFEKLSFIYFQNKNWRNASYYLDKALQFKEAPNELRGMLAKAQAEMGMKNEAITNFKKYLSSAGSDSEGWFTLGSIQFSLGQYAEAADNLQKASMMMNKNPELYSMLGKAYFKAGDFSNAITPLSKAREINKDDIQIISMLAQCYRKGNDTRNLTSILKEWVRLDNTNYNLIKELADLLIAESRLTEAAPVLEDAVKIKKCDNSLRMKLVDIYQSTGKSEQAISHLRIASQCAPKDGEIAYKVALYFKERNDMESAEEYLRKAILFSPSNLDAKYLFATYLNTKKRYSEALSHFQKLIAAQPEQQEYRIGLTESLYYLGRYADARKSIRSIALKDNASTEAMRWAGLIYRALEIPDTARQLLEASIAKDNKCGECLIALGDIYYDESDFKMASSYFKSAMDANGFNQKAALKLARSYHRLGDTQSAQRLFEEIIAKGSQNGEAIYRLTHYLLEDNQISAAKEIIAKNGANRHGWYYLADAELNIAEGKIDAALASLNRVKKLLPDAPEILTCMGKIDLKRKKYNAAIMNFAQAMAGDPENVGIMMDMGKAYEGAKEFDNAMEMYKEVSQRERENAEVYYCMARIYSKKKDHSRAIQVLRDGLRYSRNNPALHYALGHEYRAMKIDEVAVQEYLKAAKLDSQKYKDAYRHIGNIYYMKKDYKKAKKHYELYINAGGDDPKVHKILRRLE